MENPRRCGKVSNVAVELLKLSGLFGYCRNRRPHCGGSGDVAVDKKTLEEIQDSAATPAHVAVRFGNLRQTAKHRGELASLTASLRTLRQSGRALRQISRHCGNKIQTAVDLESSPQIPRSCGRPPGSAAILA